MIQWRLGLRARRYLASWVAVAALGLSPAVGQETILVFDGFDDGNRTNSPNGINWFTHSHATTPIMSVVDDSGGLGSGNALKFDTITTGQSIMGVFGSPVSLPEIIGAKLKLRFEMRNESTQNVGGTVRFGLYDADEANFPVPMGFGGMDGDWDQSQPGSYFDPGVFVQLDNDAGQTCCPPLGATRIREEPNSFFPGFGNLPFGGGDDRNVAQPPPDQGVFPGMAQGNGKNIFTLELERVAAGSDTYAWNITYTIDNGTTVASLSGPHLGPEYFVAAITNTGTYDYFALFYDGWVSELGGADFLIDNFSISLLLPSQGLAGDYNNDGNVDAADYVLWRKDPSSHGGTPDGFNTWKANFGATAPNGSGLGASAVPEPVTSLLFAIAALGAMLIGYRRC